MFPPPHKHRIFHSLIQELPDVTPLLPHPKEPFNFFSPAIPFRPFTPADLRHCPPLPSSCSDSGPRHPGPGVCLSCRLYSPGNEVEALGRWPSRCGASLSGAVSYSPCGKEGFHLYGGKDKVHGLTEAISVPDVTCTPFPEILPTGKPTHFPGNEPCIPRCSHVGKDPSKTKLQTFPIIQGNLSLSQTQDAGLCVLKERAWQTVMRLNGENCARAKGCRSR